MLTISEKRGLTRFFRQFEKRVSVPAFRRPTFIVYGGAKAIRTDFARQT